MNPSDSVASRIAAIRQRVEKTRRLVAETPWLHRHKTLRLTIDGLADDCESLALLIDQGRGIHEEKEDLARVVPLQQGVDGQDPPRDNHKPSPSLLSGRNDDDLRYCVCADPWACKEPIPGYVCRKGSVQSPGIVTAAERTEEDFDLVRQILAADMTVQPTTRPLPNVADRLVFAPTAQAVYALVQEVRALRLAPPSRPAPSPSRPEPEQG
jgi:hypothetical protein